jgi:S1-C subfamily serine protease
MIERYRPTAIVATSLAIALGTGACSRAPQFAASPQLERCYNTPDALPPAPTLPQMKRPSVPGAHATSRDFAKYLRKQQQTETTYRKAEKKYDAAMIPPTLKVPVAQGFAEGDPGIPDQSIVDHTTAALVEVATKDWKGTGFITTDPQDANKELVVTAAHVTGTASLDQLTITTQDGRRTHPTDGCYTYEDDEKFVPLGRTLGKPVDRDIAVLAINRKLTNTPLEFAHIQPKPGDWLDFVNYQGPYGPAKHAHGHALHKEPAAFTGVMTPKSGIDRDQAYHVITGAQDLGPKITVGDFDRTHLIPGGSGGPVLNAKGEIIGTSTSGTAEGYETPESLRGLYNIEFPGADNSENSGFQPTAATVISFKALLHATRSPALR